MDSNNYQEGEYRTPRRGRPKGVPTNATYREDNTTRHAVRRQRGGILFKKAWEYHSMTRDEVCLITRDEYGNITIQLTPEMTRLFEGGLLNKENLRGRTITYKHPPQATSPQVTHSPSQSPTSRPYLQALTPTSRHNSEVGLRITQQTHSMDQTTATAEQTATNTEDQPVTPTAEQTATNTEDQQVTPTAEQTATNTEDQPVTPTAEQTTTNAEDQPVTPTAEQTATNTEDQPVTPTAEQTATDTEDQPITPTAEQPATNTEDQPVTPTAEQTATDTEVQPVTPTAEQPATNTEVQPVTPTAQPTATPAAQPTATPTAEETSDQKKKRKRPGKKVFTVERIVKKRKVRGRFEYLLKWEGYSEDENTWEREEDILDPDMIQAFNDHNP